MEAPSKALMFGAGILLAIALITLSVLVYSTSTEPAKSATSDFNNLSTELKDQKYLSYDNTTVSGSQVVNAVRRFATEGKNNDLGLKIVTGQGNSTWYYNTVSNSGDTLTASTSSVSEINNTNSSQYVNPSGTFKANIVRDSNQVIRAIEFVQQSK
ncbi:hypothetical protein [Rummeliibacillus stabekisii]|uniref:hypothetical protein n=1 Tax=Rummeliibacillus stabekisii TaxID=241244 RepID=UPI00116942A6|nr:hypothetical protein [Rummeliibacillus stabekisii]MBB5171590.1 hypothetical protein [Rummeliibacillus stabekisii]GEL05558.1 hypothetical protein RST01_21850 [Rummeliibacillus stabekisii]